MKDYSHELPEALHEELEKRFGIQVANEVMKAVRLNLGKRMGDDDTSVSAISAHTDEV